MSEHSVGQGIAICQSNFGTISTKFLEELISSITPCFSLGIRRCIVSPGFFPSTAVSLRGTGKMKTTENHHWKPNFSKPSLRQKAAFSSTCPAWCPCSEPKLNISSNVFGKQCFFSGLTFAPFSSEQLLLVLLSAFQAACHHPGSRLSSKMKPKQA